jgi:EAL domain-containing protein (putative c-di-GMP-specific phosphodiesterase class I)
MIELAHNLGLLVVAEGVETEAVLTQLGELDCDAAQGYFIAKPNTADKIAQWLALSSASNPERV